MRTPGENVPRERRAPAGQGPADGRVGARRSPRSWFLLLGAALLAGCVRSPAPAEKPPPEPPSVLGANALLPSPRLIVGRIIAVDPERRFAFVELQADAPTAALAEGGELIARTLALQETGRLGVSRHQRGRTLGTRIISGQPAPNDEVVWQAP